MTYLVASLILSSWGRESSLGTMKYSEMVLNGVAPPVCLPTGIHVPPMAVPWVPCGISHACVVCPLQLVGLLTSVTAASQHVTHCPPSVLRADMLFDEVLSAEML